MAKQDVHETPAPLKHMGPLYIPDCQCTPYPASML